MDGRPSLQFEHRPIGTNRYILSWILAGISRIESLHDTLIFKGGTALKKCYFGEYRWLIPKLNARF